MQQQVHASKVKSKKPRQIIWRGFLMEFFNFLLHLLFHFGFQIIIDRSKKLLGI